MEGKKIILLALFVLQGCGLQTKCNADQAIESGKSLLRENSPLEKYEVETLYFHDHYYAFALYPRDIKGDMPFVDVMKSTCQAKVVSWYKRK